MIELSEYQARRESLLAQMQANSLAIIPAAQEVTRSRDTDYIFRQNSDFYYLTGFVEPDAFLLLSNAGNFPDSVSSIIFVRPSDPEAEIWHGRRIGVSNAPSTLGLDMAYSVDDLDELLPEFINGHQALYYTLNENQQADDSVQLALSICKNAPKQSMQAPSSIVDVNAIIHAMRLIKSESEIALMQKSAEISCIAHQQAMEICKPGMYEYQLEATILHQFAMYGARQAAYTTIVGSGSNACILHYTENTQKMKSGDLVLIDAGSEYAGYAADITRTFPVNGKFSPAQADIYLLVLKTQLACIDFLKPGVTIAQAMQLAVELITEGLIGLGILKGDVASNIKANAHREFFMHGLGHYLGLDVHDVGDYKASNKDIALSEGMVMTVEPGVYVAVNADVPDKYKGIGVRIEDNIIIMDKGNHVLTEALPKSIEAIEALMQTAH
ncbi:Xaa-Pro aminopeptidase [Glaciecola petra]|uniref:Xaa-Pro aminopeptidase n=1 Tax=Glaciecola petra TaxID=3075602 RepID=A0ABU2ZLM8_9ALTE|nr:Xaa-Pro aminopeptidase [Aestuariibacter sp. P117]MDT0593533.1 Xaa-Pro aminopeptidase [Aestuariibacter sp. P117]